MISTTESPSRAVDESGRKGTALFVCVAFMLAVMAAFYAKWFVSLDPADRQIALWVTTVGAMTNMACAVVGCYLVLRRMSLLGDALSHAVLPGLIVAFILSGSVNIGVMFIGALAAGMFTTFLVQTLNRRGGVSSDTSLGVVFTSMFALGLILIKRFTGGSIDLDPGCVFLGALDFVGVAGQPTFDVAGLSLPRPFVSIAPVLIVNVLFVIVLWKELKISSFDPALATSMGLSAGLLHYLLMGLVALTTVASFEAVGSILVVAMLIVPAATAHLLTDRLLPMLWISAALAAAASVLGYWLSYTLNVNTPGMMAVLVGVFYMVAVFCAPRYGVINKLVRNATMSMRIIREDLLAMLYRLEEATRDIGKQDAEAAVGGGWRASLSLRQLVQSGLVLQTGSGLRLSDTGRQHALQLVRSHRLWEVYLVERLGLQLDHVHDPATRMEHFIDADLREQLVEDLSGATIDPHGRDIPDDDVSEAGK